MKQTRLILLTVCLVALVWLITACNRLQQPPPTIESTDIIPTQPPTFAVPTAFTPSTGELIANPSPRGNFSMAYDSESNKIIFFGGQLGAISSNPLNINDETWTYDVIIHQWTQMKPTSGPGRRDSAEMVYDIESDRVILFGGSNELRRVLNDTWAYDYNTNTWTKMSNGPINHLGGRMAYDAESDRIVLFGGSTVHRTEFAQEYYPLKNDTWIYDFNSDTWLELNPSTSPPGRSFHAQTYDSDSDRVIIWSGDADRNASLWAYDCNTNSWEEMTSNQEPHPNFRIYPVFAFDEESDQTILFGGYPSIKGDETWAYNYHTNNWTNLTPNQTPAQTWKHAMIYSPSDDLVVLFGGQIGSTDFNYSGETWTYDLNTNTWVNVTLSP